MQLSGIGSCFYVEVDEFTPKTSMGTQIYNLIQIPFARLSHDISPETVSYVGHNCAKCENQHIL